MVTVLDRIADRRVRGIPKRRIGPIRRCCASRTGSASRRRARKGYAETREIVKSHKLVTVCEEAGCPNIGECWDEEARHLHDHGRDLHARLRLLQRRDRHARRRSIADEPAKRRRCRRARWASTHVVITSVDRDDLADGGAEHFAEVIRAIRAATPGTTIEILTPDFLRKDGALEIVVAAKPDVFNHNLETVPSNYLTVRPGARYFHSIRLLQRVKELDPTIFTKSGIMVGLGEERNEVLQLMDDLRSADVDFMTIGQYLQPSKKHHPVISFVTPDEFKSYETIGLRQGLPDGRVEPADALLAPCRRRFRQAARGARGAARKVGLTPADAEVRDHAPRSACAEEDVRARRRRREIPAIPAALRGADGALAQGARRPHDARRRHDASATRRSARPSPARCMLEAGRAATIEVKYLDGPFRYLEQSSGASSRTSDGGCDGRISSSTTSSRAACSALLMGAMFDRAFRMFAEAFEKRADEIYGDGRRRRLIGVERRQPASPARAATVSRRM